MAPPKQLALLSSFFVCHSSSLFLHIPVCLSSCICCRVLLCVSSMHPCAFPSVSFHSLIDQVRFTSTGKCWKIVSCTVSDASVLHERGERRETVRERKRWKVTDKEMSKWIGGGGAGGETERKEYSRKREGRGETEREREKERRRGDGSRMR